MITCQYNEGLNSFDVESLMAGSGSTESWLVEVETDERGGKNLISLDDQKSVPSKMPFF